MLMRSASGDTGAAIFAGFIAIVRRQKRVHITRAAFT
jgi:hypothetical protein